MKKHVIIFYTLMFQGIISLFFAWGLFFLLPHRFSEAIAYYGTLAPIIRNYYCFTLLLTGLMGILLLTRSFFRSLPRNHYSHVLSALVAVTIVFGLLIYPSVELFYQTHTGIVQEAINLYKNALMLFSIYLMGHSVIALLSGYCLFVKQANLKYTLIMIIALIFTIVPTSIMTYQKYYENEEVLLTENLKYQFVGVNGSGSIQVISNDHRLQNIFPSFINTLSYEVVNNGKLSNGEQVAITVAYDVDLAKELHLDIVDAVETTEVTGLREFYTNYASIPSKIVEEAYSLSDQYIHQKLLEALPGKETQVSVIAQYYIMNQEQTMDSVHALVLLYRISYVHQGDTYYYYRGCHINNIHSDALKNLEILEPVIATDTYRSTLCQENVSDLSSEEAKVQIYANLMNHFDIVEEIETIRQ